MERKLATIRRIAEVKAIEGADLICAYRIDGWWCVSKVNEFKVDDLVIYFEIDSWIPHEVAPFLSKGKEPREFNCVKGERLRTIRLKGQLSQGLILPLNGTQFPESLEKELKEGDDVTAELNIQKWEKPIHSSMFARAKGNFPWFIPKTDEERVQNLSKEIEEWKRYQSSDWEVTEKLDGSSMTVFFNNGEFGVCSRNLHLKTEDDNTFCNTARKYQIEEKFRECVFHYYDPIIQLNVPLLNIAIQGELVGPGIQGNRYNLAEHRFYVFAIFDIEQQKYLIGEDRFSICSAMKLDHVPVLHTKFNIDWLMNIDSILMIAEDKSILFDVEREGIVFKNQKNTNLHFKAISNKFLLKNGE